MKLATLAKRHNTDKLTHGYIPHYENHFADLKDEPVVLVEIGVASGASMRMWHGWFNNSDSYLLGIDIEPKTPTDLGKRVTVAIADGTTYDWQGEPIDIVIDDGSHTSADIMNALSNWWPHIKPGGWFVIEDLAVQVREDYGGSALGSPVTSFLNDAIREVMLGHAGSDGLGVSEVHVYDEIVFLRKA